MRVVAVFALVAVCGCGQVASGPKDASQPKDTVASQKQIVANFIKKQAMDSHKKNVNVTFHKWDKSYDIKWPATLGPQAFIMDSIHKPGSMPYRRDAKPAAIVRFTCTAEGDGAKIDGDAVVVIQDGKVVSFWDNPIGDRYELAVEECLHKIERLEKQ